MNNIRINGSLDIQDSEISIHYEYMIYRNPIYYLSVFSLLFVITTSCEKFSGNQEVPSWLSIDSIYLTTDYYSQGSSSQSITDAWVYADDQFLGAYELPARFPVLLSGKHQIRIWPGIKKNGIAATRVSYEFYSPVTRELSFTMDSTTTTGVLKTTYQSSALFVWKEDFDNVALTLDTTSRSSAFIQRTTAGSQFTFEGLHSGMIVLDSLHDYFECQTHSEYAIPTAPVFLELNFNISNSLVVGVFTYGTTILYQTPVISLNPTKGRWKKIYIDLTNTLNAYTGMTSYRVYLSAFRDPGLVESTILLDNFKIVTRKAT